MTSYQLNKKYLVRENEIYRKNNFYFIEYCLNRTIKQKLFSEYKKKNHTKTFTDYCTITVCNIM